MRFRVALREHHSGSPVGSSPSPKELPTPLLPASRMRRPSGGGRRLQHRRCVMLPLSRSLRRGRRHTAARSCEECWHIAIPGDALCSTLAEENVCLSQHLLTKGLPSYSGWATEHWHSALYTALTAEETSTTFRLLTEDTGLGRARKRQPFPPTQARHLAVDNTWRAQATPYNLVWKTLGNVRASRSRPSRKSASVWGRIRGPSEEALFTPSCTGVLPPTFGPFEAPDSVVSAGGGTRQGSSK